MLNLSRKEDTEENAVVANGDKGYKSSARIIQTKTGRFLEFKMFTQCKFFVKRKLFL